MRWGLVALLVAVLGLAALREHAAASGAPCPWAGLAKGDARVLAVEAETALGAEARGASTSGSARAAYEALASADPLAATPFAYRGALAERGGRHDEARRFFEAAVARDPRARAPRYFLAIDAIRRGDDDRAIAEFVALNAVRKSIDPGPVLTDYLRAGGKLAVVERFLATRPAQRIAVLEGLSAHPDMLSAVLSLSRGVTGGDDAGKWRGRMLESLVAAGRVDQAIRAWPRLTGRSAPRDPASLRFAASGDPAPFDWTFPAGDAGLASLRPGGSLDLLYYGRTEAVLAQRDLLLAQGRYRLSFRARGRGQPGAVMMRLTCGAGPVALAERTVVAGAVIAPFAVPAGCPSQRIEVRGATGESERESEWTLSQLSLEPVR